MTKDVVEVHGRYRVVSPHGTTFLTASVYHRMPEGGSRDATAAALRAYFERYPDLPCSWGRLTSGTCAPNEYEIEMPGCFDQRSLTCYALSPAELRL
jgi:hypothetical protein